VKNSILIFGGSVLQLSIIEKAKKMGFYTIVIDPNPNSDAKKLADEFFVVEGNDFNRTLEIALQFSIKGVVTAATDHPILMMCQIADELNLPFPSYHSCFTLLDKGEFKALLEINDISHAKGGVYNADSIVVSEDFLYPVIVKPIRGSGSRGVIKCDISSDLQKSIDECLSFCNDDRYIIEEYLEGDEISIEAYVYEHKLNIVQITDKNVSSPPYNVELGHMQPSKYLHMISDITNFLHKIVDLVGLNNCVIHPEIKIKNDIITIIEIGPRLGGDFITSKLVPLSTGIDMEEIQIKIATSQSVSILPISSASLISFLSFPSDGIVKDIVSERELKKLFSELDEFKCHLKIGNVIKPITNSLNRYGYFILKGNSVKSIEEIAITINCYLEKRMIQC
jgi:carbamoyl-phosphate synthase large subunit